jgi:hypothetical protein
MQLRQTALARVLGDNTGTWFFIAAHHFQGFNPYVYCDGAVLMIAQVKVSSGDQVRSWVGSWQLGAGASGQLLPSMACLHPRKKNPT